MTDRMRALIAENRRLVDGYQVDPDLTFNRQVRVWLGRTSDALESALQRLESAENVCEGVAMYSTIETSEKLLLLLHKWMLVRYEQEKK